MRKRLSLPMIILATVALFSNLVIGQESSYLTQKLMLENNVRKKITDALSKIIDQQKYVIDVSIDLELTSEQEEQITVTPGREPSLNQDLLDAAAALDETAGETTTAGTEGYLPIPGFEFEMSGSDAPVEAETTPTETAAKPAGDQGDKVLSRVLTDRRPSIGRVRKMDISLILQEGAAPELIENIRQIVMVASRFNRARGDELSIMTASFKERRDQQSAEAIILKSIADKVDAMEKQQEAQTAAAEADWRQELEQYKQEEGQRRQEDRSYFQSELDKIEIAARTRAFEQEKREMLMSDSLRLIQLNNEIQNLRAQLATPAITDSQAQATQSRVSQAEEERTALDAQITEKIATLESVQAELDKIQGGMNNLPLYLMGLLTFLAVVALVIVLVMTNRSKPRYAPPPPWMMQQPPRPRKKKRPVKKPEVAEKPKSAPAETPAPAPAPAATTASTPPPQTGEDPGVVQSEINDMRKAVVSMSVGQPETATRIVREWMETEAPPAPAEPEAEEEPEEETGKKKKK